MIRFTYNGETFALVDGIYNPIVLKEKLTLEDITDSKNFDQNSSQVIFIKGIFSDAMSDRLELNERFFKNSL